MTDYLTTAALRVAVIVGSTREGRTGGVIAHWFVPEVRGRDGIEPATIDLVDFDFPARYPDRATPQMRRFTALIGEADAFVVITPEYNRSFPASLKQAIDYAYDEWQAKPVGFVAYGCGSDGVYAVEQLRTVFTELHAVTVRDCVRFDLLKSGFGGDGHPVAADGARQAAKTMLDQLEWWGRALRDARAARPYVS
ncbi:MAG TPA: NAD(P)H-dependent oxidoreductase [Streptosporangiaceae bacterium]|nr:NAD(P)H-dependent oxidoreductase [Streptosporangiaceae bacterium]